MTTKPNAVQLRQVGEADLPLFFAHQQDPEAIWMAAFTAKNPSDRDAFNAHWAKIRADDGIFMQTILFEGDVAGYIVSHGWFGDLEISYWLGQAFWSKGIATEALTQFLALQTTRPLQARVVKDNIGSLKVLQKCGFVITGEDKGFAHGRQAEVEEFILRLA